MEAETIRFTRPILAANPVAELRETVCKITETVAKIFRRNSYDK